MVASLDPALRDYFTDCFPQQGRSETPASGLLRTQDPQVWRAEPTVPRGFLVTFNCEPRSGLPD